MDAVTGQPPNLWGEEKQSLAGCVALTATLPQRWLPPSLRWSLAGGPEGQMPPGSQDASVT